jgi:hypothetical protein
MMETGGILHCGGEVCPEVGLAVVGRAVLGGDVARGIDLGQLLRRKISWLVRSRESNRLAHFAFLPKNLVLWVRQQFALEVVHGPPP